MQLFKFNPMTEYTILENAQSINGATSKLWIERYRTPGEFTIVAPVSSGLKEFLPLGTFISHQDTLEVMMVESHHINEKADQDPTITITGRSFDAYFENRIVGMNVSRANPVIFTYLIDPGYTWAQTRVMIFDHVGLAATDDNDRLPGVSVLSSKIPDTGGVVEARTIKRQPLSSAVIELLAIEDLGIRSVRPNNVPGWSALTTIFHIHRGEDKTANVIFSWGAGDIEGGESLWTNKSLKNYAMIVGRWVSDQVGVQLGGPANVHYYRRMMVVDGADIDGHLTTPPIGTELANIRAQLRRKGIQVLKAQREYNLIRADVSPTTKFKYRQDYDIGDLVTVKANYNLTQKMRVVEYVESEDENGESGYPTLAIPGE